jgi:hypothetical protein
MTLFVLPFTFDKVDQRFPISPPHQFIQAGPNDHHGPCPGLNSLANHGFISWSGVDTFLNIIKASNKVYRMGISASAAVAILGLFGGNLLDPTLPISIGEPPDNVGLTGILGGILGMWCLHPASADDSGY